MTDSKWENQSIRDQLIGLIGYDFGPEPEKRIDDIRKSKKNDALSIANKLKINKDDITLELGSGCGFLSYWISEVTEKLHCCDISKNYLEFAKNECSSRPNIEFHHIDSGDLSFISDDSIDKIFSLGVFIHFNFFDIYFYLKEFKRIIKPNGRIWFDIADSDQNDLVNNKYFLEMANYYKNDRDCIASLMQWNSANSVKQLASSLGFKVVDSRPDHVIILSA